MTSIDRPCRVLMTADTVGGVWIYALELARALGTAGVEVILATLGKEPSVAQRWEAAAIPTLSIRTSTFKLEWMDEPWEDVHRSGVWLQSLERELRPDIVHLNGFCHGAFEWSAPSVVVAHSCLLSWWEAVRSGPIPQRWHRYAEEVRQGLVSADRVVAPSQSMASTIERLYRVSDVRVVFNGRDPSGVFVPGRTKQAMVFAAGRLWDDAKNFRALDCACVDLDWPLYLAGDTQGPNGQWFLPESGIALGPLTPGEIAMWLRDAAIYALPAKYEPFGLSALEAALCGCALVLGDIPSLREIWEDAAIYVAPDDEPGLRAALELVMTSPGLREDLGRRARDRANTFSHQRMAAGYLAVYRDLLGAHRAHRLLLPLNTI
jgi:glycogen(starch) synthase